MESRVDPDLAAKHDLSSEDVSGAVAVILAAGKSTRMMSTLPKVMHEVCGRPMIEYVLDSVRDAGVRKTIVVVGHRGDLVRELLSGHSDVVFAEQTEQKGTGHAVLMCREHLAGHRGSALVLAGDTPLLRSESLRGLIEDLQSNHAACVIGTAVAETNEGLGRIVRDAAGEFARIVEERDANAAELSIREINTGCYAFDGRELLWALERLRPNNKQGEYYLTDCPALLDEAGRTVIAVRRFDALEAMGINTRLQLAQVERSIQTLTQEKLMRAGVTIVVPEMTYVDPRAVLGAETIVYPFTTITGPAVIGRNCRIGPHALVHGPVQIPDSTIIPAFGAASV